MSYPQPRYTGETGEVTATFRRADEPAELPYRSGNAVHYLATGTTTQLAVNTARLMALGTHNG